MFPENCDDTNVAKMYFSVIYLIKFLRSYWLINTATAKLVVEAYMSSLGRSGGILYLSAWELGRLTVVAGKVASGEWRIQDDKLMVMTEVTSEMINGLNGA